MTIFFNHMHPNSKGGNIHFRNWTVKGLRTKHGRAEEGVTFVYDNLVFSGWYYSTIKQIVSTYIV